MKIRATLITGTTIKHLGLALMAGVVLSMGTTSAAPVKWVGGGGNWDASTQNWLDPGSSPTTFTDGDDAIFDTGGGTITVAINVAPLSTTFDSGAENYTLNSSAVGGAAGVITAGTLTKSGGSQLTINGLNSFTGKTIIEGGTVQLGMGTPTGITAAGVAGPLGAPAAGPDAVIGIHNGVTLQMGSTSPRVDQTTDRTLDLAGAGGGTVTIRFNDNDTNFTFGAVTATGTGAKTLAVVMGFQGNGDREAVIINGPISDTADDKLGLQFTYNTQTGSQSYASLPGLNTFTGPITLVKGNAVVTSYLTVGGLRTRNVTTPGSGSLGGGAYPGDITLGATTIFNYLSSASQTLSGAISGPGALTVGGGGTVTLDGACTFLGNTTVSGGSALILGTSGNYTFTITNSSSNKITGGGDATLNGTFTLDTSAVTASGGSWTLVDTATKPFGASFSMGGAGWMETANVWTKEVGASTWTFDEASGVLSLSSAAVFTSFSIPGASGSIDNNALTIQLYVPIGTDLSTLAPDFTVSSGTCDRTSGAVPSPQTFADANPLTYTITDTGPDPDVVNAYAVTVTESPMIFSGLRVWLKADAINSGNPAEVDGGGAIVQWLDSSGNGNDAANPASGDRPAYVAGGLNGLPVVRLTQDNDDNGDRLFLGDLSAQFPTAGSMFAVATLNTDGRYNIFDNRTNDSRWVADTWSESSPGVFRGGRTAFPAYGSWPQSGSHIIAMESDSSAYTFVIDGDQLGTTGGDYNSGSGQDWVIGNRPEGGQALNGDIAEFILFDRVLSPAEATQVGAYLANKYGLSTTYNPVVAGFDSFGIAGSDGVIDNDAKTISLAVPFGTDLATLAPDFTLTSGSCNQTSGSPPSPTFAAQNPATYTVTDGPTVNNFTVTVTVLPETTTYVIDLGAGTVIEGSTSGTYGLGSLPLPALPVGSILRKVEANLALEATDNDNWASELAFLIDPTPGTPGGDYSLGICNGSHFGATLELGWPGAADNGPVTPLVDTKTDADWSALGDIDLNSSGVFLGNGYGGPTVGGTWSGTITLTYDVVGGASPYDTWSAGPFPSMLPLTDSTSTVDFDGGGLQTGIEWVVGGDPTDGSDDAGLAPTVDSTSDVTYLLYTYRLSDAAAADANTTVRTEYGTDLSSWNNNIDDGVADGVITDPPVDVPGEDYSLVTVKIPKSLELGGALYVRLNVTIAP
ncbi:MAG: hypothetical protein O3A92_09495 [Verrucomicrobia bacterium]|nr:hypothetical protein [Verrucomicrobiota bacterium]